MVMRTPSAGPMGHEGGVPVAIEDMYRPCHRLVQISIDGSLSYLKGKCR